MSPERVLVRAPNWIGDVVLSLPAVRDLRRNFPAARIEVLARPAVAELYGAVPQLDAVRVASGVRASAAAVRGAFDLALLLPNSFASALEAALARIPQRWGYATDGRALLLTRQARVPGSLRGSSEVYYYRAMLAGLGLEVSASPDASLACPEPWRSRGDSLLPGDGPWIGLNPGAAFGSAKRWLPLRYAAVADRLAASLGARVAILGSGSERALADSIAAAMQTETRILCGETSLADLVGVLARLALLLTNDSGPMHLAAALGTPTLAVFGPTDWRETAPAAGRYRVVRVDVACAPCKLRECPIDHRCMRRVTVDHVVAAASELLASRASGLAS